MSDRKSKKNDLKDEEVKYLTLADKQPSLMSGNISSNSISTRELSHNLQATRDGLICLMERGAEGNERRRTSRGSDSEAEYKDDLKHFGMPIYSKGTNQSNEMANDMGQLDRNEEMSSNEMTNAGLNEYGGNDESNMYGHAQRGMPRLNGKEGYNDNKEMHKGGRDYNDLLSSQNPKKDGPLYSRIFIDAFLPSLEGNRIFPLCNYRCAEKIERMSEDYYEKQKRKFSKNLLPVTLEDSELSNYSARAGGSVSSFENNKIKEQLSQKRNCNSSSAYESLEMRKVEKSQELLVLQSIENVQQTELKNEIKRTSHENQSDQQENQVESSPRLTVKDADDEKLSAALSTDPKVEKSSEIESSEQDKVPLSSATDVKLEQDVSPIELSTQENVSSVAVEIKVERAVSSNELKESSAEEEKLLLKLLNALLANEELIDIFCEKVISKIAARNDFCGSDCKSTCGGCNKP